MAKKFKSRSSHTDEVIEGYMRNGVDYTEVRDITADTRRRVFTMGAHIEPIDKQLKVARYRHFEIFCDETPVIGGEDSYPQPLNYIAAGVGFCLLSHLTWYASMLRVPITKAECDCEFDIYVRGSVVKGDVMANVKEFRTHLRVDSPAPPAEVKKLIQQAKRGCFGEQLVRNPVPLVSTFEVNGVALDVMEGEGE